MSHPLDRPVWHALNSGWSHLAQGGADALRLDPAYGPFAAARDGSPDSLKALVELAPADGPLWVVELEAPAVEGVNVRSALVHQMVAETVTPGEAAFALVELGEDDAPSMRELAGLTKPGPFLERTHRLSQFIGVKDADGRLLAMAGERMRLEGFSEVSGVCTHPEARGRGYAGGLMRAVARRILARDETPFLHAYAANAGAIALYERLGFRLRTPIQLSVLTR